MEESIAHQKESIQRFMDHHRIMKAKLNPQQLYEYYTIPHALLYDLRKNSVQLDCLIIYSFQVIKDFIYSYPARWIVLKSYFKEIMILEEQNQIPSKIFV